MMGTDFFQFGPLRAKIIGFKEGWGPKSQEDSKTLPTIEYHIKLKVLEPSKKA